MIKAASIIATVLLLLQIPVVSHAGMSGLILSDSYENLVAVRYKTRAEYVVLPVKVTSKKRGFEQKVTNLSDTIKYLEKQAAEETQIVVNKGPAHLSPGTKPFLSTYYEIEPQIEIQMLMPVTSESENIFSGGVRLAKMLKELEPPDGIKFHPAAFRLAFENPEKMRGKILDMIAADIKTTRDMMKGTEKITVSGLEGPVKVNQADDINVELFIEYKVTFEVE